MEKMQREAEKSMSKFRKQQAQNQKKIKELRQVPFCISFYKKSQFEMEKDLELRDIKIKELARGIYTEDL